MQATRAVLGSYERWQVREAVRPDAAPVHGGGYSPRGGDHLSVVILTLVWEAGRMIDGRKQVCQAAGYTVQFRIMGGAERGCTMIVERMLNAGLGLLV